jgi:DNA-binding CsgD family transcriptional regulator
LTVDGQREINRLSAERSTVQGFGEKRPQSFLGNGRTGDAAVNGAHHGLRPDQQGPVAARLVAKLDDTERLVLARLVGGVSKRAIAAELGYDISAAEQTLASLMKKLNASSVAEAVRIGLCSEVGRMS